MGRPLAVRRGGTTSRPVRSKDKTVYFGVRECDECTFVLLRRWADVVRSGRGGAFFRGGWDDLL